MSTQRFQKALKFVLDHETVFKKGHWGDYDYVATENVPGDPGGTTRFGIDQRSHPNTNISKLTLEQATEIYWREYWLPTMADSFPAGYGEVLFDIKVNGGDGPRMLQRALNTLGADLTVDGKLGPLSVAAMQKYGKRGLEAFLDKRQERYDILARKPSLKKFHAGWTNRNNDLRKFVGL